MSDWTVIDKKDQERIWDVALALMARSELTLPEALQHACSEFYGAERALRKGIKFYTVDGEEQVLRRVRELENGTWVNERSRASAPTPDKEG